MLDLDRLDHNIAAVKAKFAQGVALRIVDKSLPSLPLLAHIRAAFATDSFMSFHLPISAAVLNAFADANLLLGKPMPVAGARHALASGVLSASAEQASRIVWLIDTDERLAAYGGLADELGQDLRICFEVDVGLHRGGFADPTALAQALVRAAEISPAEMPGHHGL